MRFALVTTTIYVPEVLREYRKLKEDVPFVIAGDLRSPDEEIRELCEELGNARYLSPDEQLDAYPILSEAVGWNSVQRRNLAVLAARDLDPPPDVIVSMDDDNEPAGAYFAQLRNSFEHPTELVAAEGWFNVGKLARSPYTYRGMPRGARAHADWSQNGYRPKVGVVNGLIYGDPDVNATERWDADPRVDGYAWAARRGIALDPARTWSPINSQNTAWVRELAPLMMVVPGVGRYDDIWASYVAQRVLQGTEWCVSFGPPFVDQDRHEHDVLDDLEAELYGMRYTRALVNCIASAPVSPERSVVANLRAVYEYQRDELNVLPERFMEAWLDAWEDG